MSADAISLIVSATPAGSEGTAMSSERKLARTASFERLPSSHLIQGQKYSSRRPTSQPVGLSLTPKSVLEWICKNRVRPEGSDNAGSSKCMSTLRHMRAGKEDKEWKRVEWSISLALEGIVNLRNVELDL